MKYVFFFIICIHALIHLLEFIKAYNLAQVSQLKQHISRQAGVAWLVAALLFIAAAILYLLNQEYWWMIGVLAILISQTMIFLSWSDAKFGTIATVIILAPLVMSIANALPGSFRNMYRTEAQKGMSRFTEMPLVSEDDMRHLPGLVQKYLRYSGVLNKPRVQNLRARFTGQIRRTPESGWIDFHSEQYNFMDEPTRLFFIESTVFGVPFDGLHCYVDSNAVMQIRIASLFQIVDAKGPTMTKGETVTLFNDMCVMAPATLIDPSIQWEPIDSSSTKATFSNKGYTISAILYFNEEGALIDFASDDRYLSSDGITYKRYRWSTPMKNYKDFGGRRVATQAELIWDTPGEEFVYGKFDLLEIEYNCREYK